MIQTAFHGHRLDGRGLRHGGEPAVGRLRVANADELAGMERACFAHPWSQAEFECVLTHSEVLAQGLWLDGQLLGYAIGFALTPQFHLANLAIAPQHRRCGHACRLLGLTLHQAAAAGCRSCTLEVRVSNRAARRLYGKVGFSLAGVRRGYYVDPREDALILTRPLGQIRRIA